MQLKSTMRHNFADISDSNVPRSLFNLSRTRKGTFDPDYIYPFFVQEVIPGDNFTISHAFYSRLNTPLLPYMDNMYITMDYFYVPNRIVWENWEKFWGFQENPGDSISFVTPKIPMAASAPTPPATDFWQPLQLGDYLGLVPQGVTVTGPSAANPAVPATAALVGVDTVHNFLGRMYNMIWNYYYRDENLQDSIPFDKDNGPDDPADYILRKRNNPKDYFMSLLPDPQKFTAPTISLGTSAPVVITSTSPVPNQIVRDVTTGTNIGPGWTGILTGAGGVLQNAGGPNNVYIDPNGAYEADLSAATGITPSAFREIFALQQYLELNMRGGTRYNELVRSEYGVFIPDSRLQWPEMLMRSTSRVHVTPVAQTSEEGTTPQGNLAAFGTVYNQKSFSKAFVEHGYIIGLLNAHADLTYQQGNDRHFYRDTRYDFHHPLFEGIGEQAVLNQEMYVIGQGASFDPTADTNVLGYGERYSEYKFGKSEVVGQMRSTFSPSLDPWHLAIEYAAQPVLGPEMIEQAMPIDRIVAVTSEPAFTFDAAIDVKAARFIKTHSNPGLRRM
nr:MAG: major capsid protein [Microvirus sp.]